MTRLLATALGAVLLVAAWPNAAQADSGTLFRLTDPRLDEVSGIARGIVSPGVFYVQNDSGDSARVFAVDARTGRVRAVYTVPNAQNDDWEDLAVARDARGVASVWLADIGDNDGDRSEVQLYRVPEPRVDMSRSDVTTQSGAAEVWRLRYPSGPVNAESLAVSPHGQAYVITKSGTGASVVYAVPRSPAGGRVQSLRRIGVIRFRSHGGPIPASLQVLATGAALSADGTWLVVRTYTDAYVWRVRGGDVATALRSAPVRIALPLQPQGEGVCIVGDRLVLDSEQVGSAVVSVPLDAATASPSISLSTSPSTAASVAASSAVSASPSAAASHGPASLALGWRIVLALASIALGLTVWLTTRRRRKRR